MMMDLARKHLTDKILPFWSKLKDDVNGGFYGYMDYNLEVDKKAVKGCILNSRILWFYSNAYLTLKDESLLAYAKHAFEFMKKAMEVLVVKRENYVITKDSSGNYLVLFHNMKTMNIHSLQQKGESIRFNDLEQIFESNGTLKLCLTLQGVEPGNYYIRKSSVSREHGSVLDESNRWSQNVSLRHDDYDYLQRICIPHIDINHQETKDNRLLLELDIISNEFGMVEIFKQF